MTPRWHIALIEPQSELKATSGLRRLGYDPYSPSFPKPTSVGRGFRTFRSRPLFPGYCFVTVSDHGWGRIREIPGMRTFNPLLMINGIYAVLPDGEIENIRATVNRLIVEASNPLPRKHKYRIGDRIIFKEGPFKGRYGNIEALDDDERIAILMDIFGRESRVCDSHMNIAAAPHAV